MFTDIPEMVFFAQSCNRHLPLAIFSSQGFLPPASVCNSPLTHGSSSLWDLLKIPTGRRFPALNPCPEEVLGSAGSLHLLFWSSQHPTNGACAVLWEHLISKSLLVTRVGKCDWQGTGQGQRRVSWLRHQVVWEGAGFWHCCLYHRVPAWGCHFVASCSNAGTCLVFWISKSAPGATWSFKASFRWFALRNSIKGTTTIKE